MLHLREVAPWSDKREASRLRGADEGESWHAGAWNHHGTGDRQGGDLRNKRIPVADLRREWLQNAEFKAEYDALADEFTLALRQVGDGKDDARHNPGTHVQENEMPHEFGSTHQSR